MCDLLQPGSNMVYYQLTGHGDIQPNPGPPRRRSKVSSSEGPPILPSDLSTGRNENQWNLRSMAPKEGNMKLEQLRTILHDPIKDIHILGINEIWLSDQFSNAAISVEGYMHEKVPIEDRELPFDKDGGELS